MSWLQIGMWGLLAGCFFASAIVAYRAWKRIDRLIDELCRDLAEAQKERDSLKAELARHEADTWAAVCRGRAQGLASVIDELNRQHREAQNIAARVEAKSESEED